MDEDRRFDRGQDLEWWRKLMEAPVSWYGIDEEVKGEDGVPLVDEMTWD